jgi:hypothetical protein
MHLAYKRTEFRPATHAEDAEPQQSELAKFLPSARHSDNLRLSIVARKLPQKYTSGRETAWELWYDSGTIP